MSTHPTSRRNDVDRVQRVFDDWAGRGRAEGMASAHEPAARAAFDRLALDGDSWYLDIGCGNGYTVRWAAAVATRGRAIGIDLSPAMVKRARDLSAGHSNSEFVQSAFPRHDLPHDRFDSVFSMEAFYYFPDLDDALREVTQLLKPGGRFACVVDYYGENEASHGWPADLGVEMTLLDEPGWGAAFAKAGMEVTEQARLRLSPAEASAPWKVTEGSLLTVGRRPLQD